MPASCSTAVRVFQDCSTRQMADRVTRDPWVPVGSPVFYYWTLLLSQHTEGARKAQIVGPPWHNLVNPYIGCDLRSLAHVLLEESGPTPLSKTSAFRSLLLLVLRRRRLVAGGVMLVVLLPIDVIESDVELPK